MSVVVAFPRPALENVAGLSRQRWRMDDLSETVVCIRRPRERFRVPPTPERALLKALVGQLTPKAYTGLLTTLAAERERGCPYSGVAFLIATERLDDPA